MNRPGSIICTGSFSNISSYTAVTLSGSPAVPRKGWVTRVKTTKTGGAGTGARMKVIEPVTNRVVLEVDSETTPGDPVTFDANSEVNFAVTGRLWYDRGTSALIFQVSTDDSTTDGTVECEIEPG